MTTSETSKSTATFVRFDDPYDLESAAASIIEAERPCVLVGAALPASEAAAIAAFCHKLTLPVFPLGSAEDAPSFGDAACFHHALGRALEQADLVLAIGLTAETSLATSAPLLRIEPPAGLQSLLEAIGYAEEDGGREREAWLRRLAAFEQHPDTP